MIRHLILFICFLSGFSDLFAQNVDTDSVKPLDLKFSQTRSEEIHFLKQHTVIRICSL